MGEVTGELLPLALAVTISPIPIIAVILMLLAPKAGATSIGFGLGWTAGIVVATAVFIWLASAAGPAGSGQPSAVISWLKLALGVLLIVLSFRQWRHRPAPGGEPATPKWMDAVDRFTPVKAAGLGAGLAAVNPKNLAMCVSAGVTIGGAGLPGGQVAVTLLVYTVIAAAGVVVPVVGYAVARKRLSGPLDSLKSWLLANNATVMCVLFLVIGVVLLGKGIGGLA